MITSLFGLDSVIISQQSIISIDFESGVVSIEYVDLKGPAKELELVMKDLKSMSQDEVQVDEYAGCTLESVTFVIDKSKLNASVVLKLSDKDAFMEYVPLMKGPKENVFFEILAQEKVVRTNGKKTEIEDMSALQYERDQAVEISVKLSDSKEFKQQLLDYYGEMISLGEAWEK